MRSYNKTGRVLQQKEQKSYGNIERRGGNIIGLDKYVKSLMDGFRELQSIVSELEEKIES